jgi:hypothetical protein
MKQFQLNPITRKFDFGEMEVIVLGKRGDNSFESLIPYQSNKEDFVSITTTQKGKPKIVSTTNKKDWLAFLSAKSNNSNGYNSVFCYNEESKNIQIVEKGHGSYGTKKEDGVYFEFLAIIPEETIVRVKRYNEKKQWYIFKKDEVLIYDDKEYLSYCLENGDLIDLAERLLDFNKIPLIQTLKVPTFGKK